MLKWLRNSVLVLLTLAIGYLLTVQVLRWIAFGEEERLALALMEVEADEPTGSSGFMYLAFNERDIPVAELDQALARELAAYREWHAGWGARLLDDGFQASPENPESFDSPVAATYPERPPVDVPDAACGLRETDCLGKLRGHEDAVRAWLQADAARLALAEQALASDHLANPYPPALDSPLAAFQLLRMPVNDIALQALDGDVTGATARACDLLAAERRFLAQDGLLIDKMVHGSLVDGAAALLLGLRRMDPDAPLPDRCSLALAPVAAGDFLACGALRKEYEMISSLSTAMHEATQDSWNPKHWLSRWALTDDRLMRAWTAGHFAPMCEPESQADILGGEVPDTVAFPYDPWSVDFWAAPISHILAAIAAPDYRQYQERLLDQAASLRLHLAAIAAVGGELPFAQLPEAAASPGYEITIEDGHWVLPLRRSNRQIAPELRVAIPASGHDPRACASGLT